MGDWKEQGNQFFAKGNYVKAIECYSAGKQEKQLA